MATGSLDCGNQMDHPRKLVAFISATLWAIGVWHDLWCDTSSPASATWSQLPPLQPHTLRHTQQASSTVTTGWLSILRASMSPCLTPLQFSVPSVPWLVCLLNLVPLVGSLASLTSQSLHETNWLNLQPNWLYYFIFYFSSIPGTEWTQRICNPGVSTAGGTENVPELTCSLRRRGPVPNQVRKTLWLKPRASFLTSDHYWVHIMPNYLEMEHLCQLVIPKNPCDHFVQ